jgi:hypothetical protein
MNNVLKMRWGASMDKTNLFNAGVGERFGGSEAEMIPDRFLKGRPQSGPMSLRRRTRTEWQ